MVGSEQLQELRYKSVPVKGMLLAHRSRSAIASFAFSPEWTDGFIKADLHEIDGGGEIRTSEIQISNLSQPQHVEMHKQLLISFGYDISSSTLIHEGRGFVVRIYFNDHEPAHFHVLGRRDDATTLAKYAIETLDVIEGNLTGELRRRVEAWAKAHKNELLLNWQRCQDHEHPFLLDD